MLAFSEFTEYTERFHRWEHLCYSCCLLPSTRLNSKREYCEFSHYPNFCTCGFVCYLQRSTDCIFLIGSNVLTRSGGFMVSKTVIVIGSLQLVIILSFESLNVTLRHLYSCELTITYYHIHVLITLRRE